MKNRTSELDNNICVDGTLKRPTADNVMVIGRLLPSRSVNPTTGLNHNNNNNIDDDDGGGGGGGVGSPRDAAEVQRSLLVKDRPSLDPRYFYSVGHRRRPSWLTSWPDTLDASLCRTCHRDDGIAPRLKTSSTSLESGNVDDIKSSVITHDALVSNGHVGSSISASPQRMARSMSLGVDLPTKTGYIGDTTTGGDRCRCLGVSDCSEARGNAAAVATSFPPVSLSAVLENIPLAYDPLTKKLHIMSVPKPSEAAVAVNHESPLKRVTTSGSLPSRTECSSFSSVSSLSTELSSAHEDVAADEPNFIEIGLERRRFLASGQPSVGGGSNSSSSEEAGLDSSQGAKPKSRGITGFLSRNLLPWKFAPRDQSSSTCSDGDGNGDGRHRLDHPQSLSNWKFFSARTKDPGKIIDEYRLVNDYNSSPPSNTSSPQRQQIRRTVSSDSSSSTNSTPRRRRGDNLGVTSTTALILENRPLNLPAKAPEEELKHRLEYEQMVEDAKRRELKEVKLKKKHLQQQLKHEERLSLASKIWNVEILNNWESMRTSRKARELWWQGIPPNVRGKVWMLAIGNDLHITPELYEICVCRAKDRIRMAAESISVSEDVDVEAMADKEGSVELIKLDVSRTFPQLCIFQKGGPYYDLLHSLLGAYVCYRPDVGYVQGMSFLAAILILNLEVADAFVCFANLLNQPCQLAFFRLDESMMRSYFLTYEEFFRENMPNLFAHFSALNLSPDLYLIDWIYTLYSRSLPLDVASRVWDVFFRDGDEFLFRTALGLLRQYEDLLMRLDFIHVAQFLTKLPDDMESEPLFRSIESIRMTSDKRTFAQVLVGHSDPKQT